MSTDTGAVAHIGNLKEAPAKNLALRESPQNQPSTGAPRESPSALSICLTVSQGMNFTGPITMLSAQSHGNPFAFRGCANLAACQSRGKYSFCRLGSPSSIRKIPGKWGRSEFARRSIGERISSKRTRPRWLRRRLRVLGCQCDVSSVHSPRMRICYMAASSGRSSTAMLVPAG